MKKKILNSFIVLFFVSVIAIAQTTDGPYLFYKNDSINTINVVNVVPKDSLNKDFDIQFRQIQNLKKDEVLSFTVVPFSSNKNDAFKVQTQTQFVKQKSIYKAPKKLVALSDIEGNFYAFKKILIGAKIMNTNYEWIFGEGHLVFVGDIFDRGNNVTQCLWLIYELERQAELNGGKVHFVMGNHENMNLRGSTKYVKDKYLDLSKKLKLPYKEMFGNNTELGQWLRTKNTVVKIGSTLYVHAGISIDMINEKYTLDDINRIAKKYYGNPNRKEIQESSLVFDTKRGPLWYRGYFKNDIGNKGVSKILEHFNSETIVVGHTVQNKIKTFFKNRIIAIDLKHPRSHRDGIITVLLKEANVFYIVDENNNREKLF
ncbi:MAG: metallophosphoesterase [Algibacter sp.]